MFPITWRPMAFERMQALISAHPELLTEFTYALRALTVHLSREADTWGESRDGPFRIGFIGVLAVRYMVDPDDRVATIVNVGLCRGRRSN